MLVGHKAGLSGEVLQDVSRCLKRLGACTKPRDANLKLATHVIPESGLSCSEGGKQ